MTAAAQRWDRIADAFGRRVAAVPADAWDRPTPCQGWVARDVVGHLVGWVPGFFGGVAGLDVPALPDIDDDPAGAWTALDDQVRSWLADPAVAERSFDGPMGRTTVAEAVDRLVTTDVLVHTWDLARAVGLDDRLDPAEVEGMADAMAPADAALRSSGHYGPRVEVDQGADEQDRLLGFLGRDPAWTPPGGSSAAPPPRAS